MIASIANSRPIPDLDAVLAKLPCGDSALTHEQQMELDRLVDYGHAEQVKKWFQWFRPVTYQLTETGLDLKWQREQVRRQPWLAA